MILWVELLGVNGLTVLMFYSLYYFDKIGTIAFQASILTKSDAKVKAS